MAFVAADWTIDRETGDIRYTGDDHGGAAPSYCTVIQFHRALQAFADDAASAGNDELDITDVNPSARSTDNYVTLLDAWNIDDTAAEHIYDGSIVQDGGDVIYDGIVNFGPAGITIQIIQNGAVLADDWWNAGGGLNDDAAQGISHRFMLKTRTGGADIDGRRLIGTSRTFGQTYSEFKINGTTRGNNVLALSQSSDLNNQTIIGTVAGWTDITNETEGYAALDINNDSTDEYYYSEWNRAAHSINDFFERMKWLTRDGSASTMYGLSGELFRGITHEITVDNADTDPTDFDPFEAVSWTGGTGQMLAINDVNAPTKMWIQLLTGVPPTDGQTITGGTSGATADVNVTVTDRQPVSTPFVGASTGSALIGSYGLGMEVTDLAAADKVFDLSNTQVSPPNYVTFIVGGLVSGEDRVLVGPWDGASYDAEGNPAIDTNQMSLNAALTGAAVTSIVMASAIPTDTPASGTIRVQLNNGSFRRQAYTSYTGSTFTVPSTDYSGANNADASNDAWVSYIDDDAAAATIDFTSVFLASRNLVVKVRDGGASPIKEYISSATLGSAGGSVTAIRTSDA